MIITARRDRPRLLRAGVAGADARPDQRLHRRPAVGLAGRAAARPSARATSGAGLGPQLGLFALAAVIAADLGLAEARSDEPADRHEDDAHPHRVDGQPGALLFGMGMYSMFAFLPQFLQTPDEVTGYGFGASVTESGLLLLPQTVATFVAGLASGRLAARFGSKAMLVAGATLTRWHPGDLVAHDQLWQVLIESTVLGLAFGLAFAAMSNLVVDAVPQTQTGVASGMNANIRTVGGALGGPSSPA